MKKLGGVIQKTFSNHMHKWLCESVMIHHLLAYCHFYCSQWATMHNEIWMPLILCISSFQELSKPFPPSNLPHSSCWHHSATTITTTAEKHENWLIVVLCFCFHSPTNLKFNCHPNLPLSSAHRHIKRPPLPPPLLEKQQRQRSEQWRVSCCYHLPQHPSHLSP